MKKLRVVLGWGLLAVVLSVVLLGVWIRCYVIGFPESYILNQTAEEIVSVQIESDAKNQRWTLLHLKPGEKRPLPLPSGDANVRILVTKLSGEVLRSGGYTTLGIGMHVLIKEHEIEAEYK